MLQCYLASPLFPVDRNYATFYRATPPRQPITPSDEQFLAACAAEEPPVILHRERASDKCGNCCLGRGDLGLERLYGRLVRGDSALQGVLRLLVAL